MAIPIYTVDAFTSEAFHGNPASVCLLPAPRDAAWMQAVSAEMNLSETAFLHPEGEVSRLRWFTPRIEVELCGHATLASAHVLWETGRIPRSEPARFETLSGRLAAVRRGDDVELDFPATPAEPASPPPGLLAALGPAAARPRFVGRTRFDWLVEIDSEAAVRALRPDLPALRSLGGRGVIVTAAASTKPFDFVSRFFAPAAGVDEDPVTGSSHCALAPYWRAKTVSDELLAAQLSARGGVLRVRVAGARVAIAGRAVTVLRGELAVD